MQVRVYLALYCVLFARTSLATESELELVQVFFRHGCRTPEYKDTYPTDPYTEKDFLPMGWGQLTNAGKLQAYQLGQLLRKRYGQFLGDVYTPETAVTLATDFDRTKISALLALSGLFPPSPVQKWHDEIPWNPIPYQYLPADNDYFLRRPTHYCRAYVDELERVFRSEITSTILKENLETLDYIGTNTGKPMKIMMDVFRVYQTLNAEDCLNMTLPAWTESIYPEKIHDLAAKQCYLENSSVLLKRLNGGRSLARVIENMRAKVKNATPGTKIYLYSGHENNVVNVLAALNLFEPHFPKYSSAVIIEMHRMKKDGIHAVKIVYVRDVEDKPEELTLNGCDLLCPFDAFINVTLNYVPVNYTLECESRINLG